MCRGRLKLRFGKIKVAKALGSDDYLTEEFMNQGRPQDHSMQLVTTQPMALRAVANFAMAESKILATVEANVQTLMQKQLHSVLSRQSMTGSNGEISQSLILCVNKQSGKIVDASAKLFILDSPELTNVYVEARSLFDQEKLKTFTLQLSDSRDLTKESAGIISSSLSAFNDAHLKKLNQTFLV